MLKIDKYLSSNKNSRLLLIYSDLSTHLQIQVKSV